MFRPFLLLSILSLCLNAKHLQKEKVYQEHFCQTYGGQTEYVLQDRTRVDCLLDEYAIEVDFAAKWAESIGQSLYYAQKTNRKAAVLLIIEDEYKESKYLKRLKEVSRTHPIHIWTINKEFKIDNSID